MLWDRKSDLFGTRAAIGVWKGWNTDLVVMETKISVVYVLYHSKWLHQQESLEPLRLGKSDFLLFHPPCTMGFKFSAGTLS